MGKIHQCILETLDILKARYPSIPTQLKHELHFFTSQQLLDMYPGLEASRREYEICKKFGSVFIIGIGKKLSDGSIHDQRAADYDDWDLNGDLIYYDELLDLPVEISSMGIRVDSISLQKQLIERNEEYKERYRYHQMIIHDELPLTIGGGIGESRLCMLLMNKAHIGEVQSSIWDDDTARLCYENNIILL